jgi:hypothetical protein
LLHVAFVEVFGPQRTRRRYTSVVFFKVKLNPASVGGRKDINRVGNLIAGHTSASRSGFDHIPVDVNVDVSKLSNTIGSFATISLPISYLLVVLLHLLVGSTRVLQRAPASSKALLFTHVLSPTLKGILF